MKPYRFSINAKLYTRTKSKGGVKHYFTDQNYEICLESIFDMIILKRFNDLPTRDETEREARGYHTPSTSSPSWYDKFTFYSKIQVNNPFVPLVWLKNCLKLPYLEVS